MFYTQKQHDKAVKETTDPLNEQITTLTGERDTATQNQTDLEAQNEMLTTERDAAIQERNTLQSQIDEGSGESSEEATQELNQTFESLDELDESVQNAETTQEKTTAVVELVNNLRQTPGAKSTRLKSKTEAKPADQSTKDENVSNESKSFMENIQAVGENLL